MLIILCSKDTSLQQMVVSPGSLSLSLGPTKLHSRGRRFREVYEVDCRSLGADCPRDYRQRAECADSVPRDRFQTIISLSDLPAFCVERDHDESKVISGATSLGAEDKASETYEATRWWTTAEESCL